MKTETEGLSREESRKREILAIFANFTPECAIEFLADALIKEELAASSLKQAPTISAGVRPDNRQPNVDGQGSSEHAEHLHRPQERGISAEAIEGKQAEPPSQPAISAEEFWKTYPHCIGYPGCDGDLEGTSHEPGCPLFGKKDVSMADFAEAYAKYVAEYYSLITTKTGNGCNELRGNNGENVQNDHRAESPSHASTQLPIFTPVLSLNDYQNAHFMHPFTCASGNRSDEHHAGGGSLVATSHGWICPFCDYTQDWAHEFMKNGDWRKAAEQQNAARSRPSQATKEDWARRIAEQNLKLHIRGLPTLDAPEVLALMTNEGGKP